MPNLPFQVGEMVESKSFQCGYRGAWFRCKIREICMKGGAMTYLLEYPDYAGQKPSWVRLYQKPIHIRKSKGSRELMVRPWFPTIHHESEKLDVNTISEVIVIVDDTWKVGDLVDWLADGCHWSGEVTKILGNGKVQIDLLPPPLGQGSSYEALSKDLRPSLDWCPEKGWTVPLPMLQEVGCRCPCARIMNPANSGGTTGIHATDGDVKVSQPTPRTDSLHSSQNFEGLLECPDRPMERRKPCNTDRNGVVIAESDHKKGKTCFSDSVSSDASIENLERATINRGYNDEHPAKKMRSSSSLCLNSMSSNTIEAAILDLEELVNRIKWLRDVLNLGVPLSGTKHPSWEFLQHHAPCK